ncbi:response regulator [Undibacterium sp.]|jgi:two-component system NtrC family sensor kinase|uniref:response regulator n=1 Tax=Undibacterium sp. TaxID=1914977 RepID=UPI002CDFA0A4|nr:response regulator [Undibacterium sp.]HTD06314.1 response regulator [Undibacterium sp.]
MNEKTRQSPVVLIVDDDAMTRMLVIEALEPEGFEIEEAASGAEGIEVFQRAHPDIVLLDVSMPGMNGFECCERIRKLPDGAHVPIVVLTGNDDDDSITSAFEAGATDFVSKPMRWKLLGHRIRYLLRASGVLDDLARSEARLSEANAELSQTNSKLALAHVQLLQSEKMASIGQLAAGVAHEINNPIAYIFSNFGTLENYLEKLFNMLTAYEGAEKMIESFDALADLNSTKREMELDFLRSDIPEIMQESRDGLIRVKEIVQSLKDFSRVDSTRDWQLASLNKGIDSTLKVINSEIKYKADIVKEYGNLPEVECLPSQLNQVFMNIIVNAAHAMGDKKGQIIIRTSAAENTVCIEITDNGTGIPEDMLSRIFEPFFTTKPIGQGTGLGLSIAYGIIKSHGGRIEVESEQGSGTSFFITLPVTQSSSENQQAPSQALHNDG